MNKLFAFVFSLFMASSVFALGAPNTANEFRTNPCGGSCGVSNYFPSAAESCTDAANRINTTNGAPPPLTVGTVSGAIPELKCNYTRGSISDGFNYISTRALQCPANSTFANNQCTCNSGFTDNGTTCEVQTNLCAAKTGIPQVTNFTIGYARTDGQGSNSSDNNCVAGCATAIPASICDSGCVVSLGQAVAGWRSVTPTSNGLYRDSVDFATVPTGTQCTAGSSPSNNPANPTIPNPPCPGFVGEVNGKTTCVGTAAKPIATNTMPPAAAQVAPGNPAAGVKPSSGEGSGSTGEGRTPATGSGGSAGGPASSAIGATGSVPQSGTGTVQQVCGAPGQPKCRIDESGTPGDAAPFFSGAKTDLESSTGSAQSAISGAQGISAPAWTFSFQLPTGCTPYQTGIKGFVMNPCQYQGVIHDLMSMIWAAVTAFFIIGMVGRTIRES